MRSPYVKLYRDEPGSFGQLPLMTRALAKQLMILADNDGVIHLGRRSPHEAVCFGMGAERTERRSVRGHLELLLADGYLVLDEERRTLTIPSFPRIGDVPPPQPQRSAVVPPTEPQQSVVVAPTETHRSDVGAPTERQQSSDGASSELQHEAKCAESRDGDPHIRREEEKREEESRGAPERPTPRPVPARFDPFEYHASHPVVVAVVEAWRAAYLGAWGRPYVHRGHGDALAAGRLAHWCELHAAGTGADASEVAARIVANFAAAKRAAGGTVPAQTWLDPDHPHYPLDPAAYLEAAQPRPRVARARGPQRPSSHEAHRIPPGTPEPPPIPESEWGDQPVRSHA